MSDARAMQKLFKEAGRVKQVLSANTDHFAQVVIFSSVPSLSNIHTFSVWKYLIVCSVEVHWFKKPDSCYTPCPEKKWDQ